MVFPPGQGKSGPYLMSLWRHYLEEYAEKEGQVKAQILAGAYHSAEIFGFLSRTLDREGRYSAIIEERTAYFESGSRKVASFEDATLNASFALYNHLNTLSQQLSAGNSEALDLIRRVGAQIKARSRGGGPIERSSFALRGSFPLLGLMALVIDQERVMTRAIRQVEQRFAAADLRTTSDWERLLNALYRIVEMMQVFVSLSGAELTDQVQQIASRFQEEDQTQDLWLKLRNGFCRTFELAHLVTTHLDEVLPA